MSSSSSALTGHIGALLAHVKSLHHELLKLSKAGALTAEQIQPFQDHLRTIESHKHDGVWCGNLSAGQVPHGQAQVQEQFQETMDLVQSLLEVRLQTRRTFSYLPQIQPPHCATCSKEAGAPFIEQEAMRINAGG